MTYICLFFILFCIVAIGIVSKRHRYNIRTALIGQKDKGWLAGKKKKKSKKKKVSSAYAYITHTATTTFLGPVFDVTQGTHVTRQRADAIGHCFELDSVRMRATSKAHQSHKRYSFTTLQPLTAICVPIRFHNVNINVRNSIIRIHSFIHSFIHSALHESRSKNEYSTMSGMRTSLG